MKKFLRIFFGIAVIANLSGCLYGQCMDGPCAFERAKIIENIKPYGAHWIKDGMTRESRRIDLASCGALNGEEVNFDPARISAIRRANEPNDIAAYLRLRDDVGLCMREKGYMPIGDLKYLGGCDTRCLHP